MREQSPCDEKMESKGEKSVLASVHHGIPVLNTGHIYQCVGIQQIDGMNE